MARVGYATVGSDDLPRAKAFYDALLGTIGLKQLFEHPRGGHLYGDAGGLGFGVLKPANGEAASVGNGTMAAFSFDTTEEVAAFHAKALELGSIDEGAPGERGPGAYFAYFRDPDGNKLCGYKMG